MRTNENILLSSLTTMRLGGPARYVVEVESPEEVPQAYGFAAANRLPAFALGGGANTIGHDNGFNGVIIINRMRGISENDGVVKSPALADIDQSLASDQTPPHTLRIMGGEPWDSVVEYTCNHGLTGIEALSRIPGLTGAAPVQNIGAYGQEIADVIESIDVYDTATNTFTTLSKADLNFSYRKSLLNTTAKGRYFVISVTLQLKKGQMSRPFYNSIERYIAEYEPTDFTPSGIRNIVSAIRADKLPDPLTTPSAGSFFKNVYINESEAESLEDKGLPIHRGKDGIKISTAWLIEKAGLRGQLIHGFRVSAKAPLVLINESATTYAELAQARDVIINKVYDEFGFWLEQEPVEIP